MKMNGQVNGWNQWIQGSSKGWDECMKYEWDECKEYMNRMNECMVQECERNE